jgi:type IV secretion system protein TrbJ
VRTPSFHTEPLKLLALGILLTCTGAAPQNARAQWAVIDVASIQQQLIAYLEQVNQYLMQAQQLEQAVLQYQNMVKNTLDLPAAVWANVGATLNGLNTIIANGQSIANQSKNLNLAFTTMFPTYQTIRGTAVTNTTYQNQYQTWSNNTRSSLQTSVSTAAQLLNAKATDQSTVSSLQSQAQGATGNLQAVKAAAAVASQEVLELQQLKLLLAENVATQGQYIAELESQRAMNEAATEQALSGSTPAYGSGRSY